MVNMHNNIYCIGGEKTGKNLHGEMWHVYVNPWKKVPQSLYSIEA